MKEHILPALKLTFFCVLLFVFAYPLGIRAISVFAAPNEGRGAVIRLDGRIIGYRDEGQSFTADRYFYSRPSAVGYNAAGSGASNLAPSNPQLTRAVEGRIDSFLVHNPAVRKEDIPADLVTTSGSGLDPDISIRAAMIQIPRIAKIRNISPEKLKSLVNARIQGPLLGFLGPEKINVLELNIALDGLKK